MKVISIQSCCAGVQFIDFPSAHYEGPKSDSAAVIELIGLMLQYKSNSFFHAFVNHNQDRQMKKIFEALGWDRHECGTRVFLYVHTNPARWFVKNGLTPGYQLLMPECAAYKTHNDRARANWQSLAAQQEAIIAVLEKFGVKLKDVPALAGYFIEPPKPDIPVKPKRAYVRKAKLAPTNTAVEEDATPGAPGAVTYTTHAGEALGSFTFRNLVNLKSKL